MPANPLTVEQARQQLDLALCEWANAAFVPAHILLFVNQHEASIRAESRASRPAEFPSLDKCHICNSVAMLVREERLEQWGGASGELPFFYNVHDEHYRCEACGTEWYTSRQMQRLESQCLHAMTDAWRKLATVAPPAERTVGEEEK